MSQVIALTLSKAFPKQGHGPRFPGLWAPVGLKGSSGPLIHPAGDRATYSAFPTPN